MVMLTVSLSCVQAELGEYFSGPHVVEGGGLLPEHEREERQVRLPPPSL